MCECYYLSFVGVGLKFPFIKEFYDIVQVTLETVSEVFHTMVSWDKGCVVFKKNYVEKMVKRNVIDRNVKNEKEKNGSL